MSSGTPKVLAGAVDTQAFKARDAGIVIYQAVCAEHTIAIFDEGLPSALLLRLDRAKFSRFR